MFLIFVKYLNLQWEEKGYVSKPWCFAELSKKLHLTSIFKRLLLTFYFGFVEPQFWLDWNIISSIRVKLTNMLPLRKKNPHQTDVNAPET